MSAASGSSCWGNPKRSAPRSAWTGRSETRDHTDDSEARFEQGNGVAHPTMWAPLVSFEEGLSCDARHV